MHADPAVLWQPTPDGASIWALSLLTGLACSVLVVALAWLLALLLGVSIGVVRTLPRRWVVACGDAWVELFRNVPLLVQFFLWYYVLPELLPPYRRLLMGLSVLQSQLLVAVVCLGLFTSARIAEQVRAGLQALPRGQTMAARALGLGEGQVLLQVLLPQALRKVLPPLGSEAMNLVKNSAVAYSIGLTELFLRSREMGELTFDYFTAFAAATLLYALLALSIGRAFARLERRLALPGYVGAGR